jgi:fused signal recognition particle receptor
MLTTLPNQAPPADGSLWPLMLVAIALLLLVLVAAVRMRSLRQERINEMTKVLDAADASSDLRVPSIDASAPAASADDLLVAERKAQRLKAEAEATARQAKRSDSDVDANAAAQAQAEASAAANEAKRLRLALHKTRDGLVGKLGAALTGRAIDDAVLDDIEGVLFGADIGARTADKLLQAVKRKLSRKELSSTEAVVGTLREEAKQILAQAPSRPLAVDGAAPRVVLVLGVNGAGKTTTIGKLANQLKQQGKQVLLGAGDTFRAAAADQLEVWANRADVPIVTGPDGGDPSSVLFDAVKRAKAEGFDVVLCDTAGRLHTKTNLMDELKKVARTLNKACDGAPHEVLLVLDATVGQNAIAQAKQFGEAAPLTGIVLTKLDGTAKGGVVLGIVDELKVPVRYVGVGEGIADLRAFDADAFLEALFEA